MVNLLYDFYRLCRRIHDIGLVVSQGFKQDFYSSLLGVIGNLGQTFGQIFRCPSNGDSFHRLSPFGGTEHHDPSPKVTAKIDELMEVSQTFRPDFNIRRGHVQAPGRRGE